MKIELSGVYGLKHEKKWYLYGDELRYGRAGKLAYLIDIGDVELALDEDGEIVEIAIYNANKYFPREVLEKIAEIHMPEIPSKEKAIKLKID